MSGDWIPVTERLPEEHVDVLAVAPGYNVTEVWIGADKVWRVGECYDTSKRVECVTHWMPMPAPPADCK